MCLRPLAIKKEDTPCRVVPCGQCILCLKRKQNGWSFRLQQEEKISKSSCFLTLTYENTPLSSSGIATLKKQDLVRFIKKVRKKVGYNYYNKKVVNPIKYYACGEYGSESKRPHYHAIMFNLPNTWITDGDNISNTWNKGHIHIDPCTPGTIKYVTKYLLKGKLVDDYKQKEFSLMSKGLGKSYLTPQIKKFHRENLQSYITLPGGAKTTLPKYFADEIFDDEMKEKIKENTEKFRNESFEKSFKSDLVKKLEWKNDKRRQQKKAALQERTKI